MTTTGGVDGREFAEAVDEVDFDELHGGLVEGLLEDVAVDEGELAGGDGGDVDDDGGGELGLGVEGVVEGAFVAVDEVAGPERVDAAGAGAGVGDGDLDDAVLARDLRLHQSHRDMIDRALRQGEQPYGDIWERERMSGTYK